MIQSDMKFIHVIDKLRYNPVASQNVPKEQDKETMGAPLLQRR